MIPLNLILSANKIIDTAPKLMVLVCAFALLIAFFVGFAKGYRKVGWTWLTCLVAFVAFVYFDDLTIKKGIADKLPTKGSISSATMMTLIVAFGCLAIALTLYGIFTALLRPKKVWKKKDRERYKQEQRSGTGDGNPKYLVWKNYAPPSFLGRLNGGLICMLNVAAILALGISFIVLFIHATPLADLKIGLILKVKITDMALKYAKDYALDFVTLCIPFFIACYGYKRGCVSSLRNIIVNAGSILIFVLAFWLPFSNIGAKSNIDVIGKMNDRCFALLTKVPAQLRMIAAKLMAGVILLLVFAAILVVINYVLGKFETAIQNAKGMQVIDGIVSCSLYFLIGVVACVAVWGCFYAAEHFGFFQITKAISEKSVLSQEMLDLVKSLSKLIFKK